MQTPASPPSPPPTTTLPPPQRSSSGSGLATALAAVAIVLALIALAVAFVVPGPAGSQGGTGNPPAMYFAVVSSSGGLARSSGVSSSYQVATGQYQVNFTTIQYGCSYTADLGTTAAGTQSAGSVKVSSPPTGGVGANVTTFNATGSAANESFHIVASCPGGLYASVTASGTFSSGAGVTHSDQQGTGAYEVIFNTDVSGCAYVASLSSGSGSATVASRAGNLDGVWVNTYNSAGTLTNESFQVTVTC